ncbi:tRNA (adenosine(37)-N6)-dimethylallyltransferase MiaA [Ruminococcus sp.]|uniref:tRNA (adenosine(37)-N6)-dimethylallyltransferase MiaA n=1 Tax=Ruminococcus sp. TaxID=41978 RepID=UPI003F049CBC
MEQEKIPVLAVVGPTASGKTALGIALAQAYGGEIVSADSMQIYRGMDIATAKPTAEELAAVPHHLIGFLPPEQSFSVADYVEAARRVIGEIHSRGKLPVVVGGTGLYVTSLLEHVQFADMPRDDTVRAALQAQAAREGTQGLYAELCRVDPESAACIHPNNIPRLVRAMEVYRLTGRPLSAFKAESRQEPSPYRTFWLGLYYPDRQQLYDRINRRVDQMVQQGLIEEARAAYAAGGMGTAAAAIGYKELIPYLEGRAELADCIARIKQETRRYAKRQMTWFRKNEQIQWISRTEFDEAEEILLNCKKKIAKAAFL